MSIFVENNNTILKFHHMKTGIIQQHNTANIESNIERLCTKITHLAHEGAELIVLQELHNGLYFCQTEDVDLFD